MLTALYSFSSELRKLLALVEKVEIVQDKKREEMMKRKEKKDKEKKENKETKENKDTSVHNEREEEFNDYCEHINQYRTDITPPFFEKSEDIKNRYGIFIERIRVYKCHPINPSHSSYPTYHFAFDSRTVLHCHCEQDMDEDDYDDEINCSHLKNFFLKGEKKLVDCLRIGMTLLQKVKRCKTCGITIGIDDDNLLDGECLECFSKAFIVTEESKTKSCQLCEVVQEEEQFQDMDCNHTLCKSCYDKLRVSRITGTRSCPFCRSVI